MYDVKYVFFGVKIHREVIVPASAVSFLVSKNLHI